MPLRVQVALGDFRRKTADLPDDTALMIETEHCAEWCEVSALSMKYLPPSLDAPGALILDAGQEMTEGHHIGPRLDVYLDCGDWGALKP